MIYVAKNGVSGEYNGLSPIIAARIKNAGGPHHDDTALMLAKIRALEELLSLVVERLPYYDQVIIADRLGFKPKDESEQ